jgi:diguanylate cyclase (GGDEF)-like protein
MTSQTAADSTPSKKLRILVAEGGFGQVSAALGALYPDGAASLELTVVSSASTLLPMIQFANPEVAFVDLALDPADPLGFVRSIHRAAPTMPLIVLAGPADRENAQLSLREGAADYLLKEHTEPRTVERALRTALERNAVNGLTELLRDPVTQFYNQEGFSALATRALQSAQKCGGRMVLLSAEIANLKDFPLDSGPGGRDQAVRDVAALFHGSFRRTDLIARLGDAEFAVLALDALEPTVAIMRQRVEKHLTALNLSRARLGEISLSLNFTFWNANVRGPFHELLLLMEKTTAPCPENRLVDPKVTEPAD